jgi:NADH-quinone oxidoreductase subunit L
LTAVISRKAAKLQSGYVYHYAFVMLIGLVGFVTWSFMRGLGGN